MCIFTSFWWSWSSWSPLWQTAPPSILSLYSSLRGVCVKITQSCPTLWDLMDCTVHGILQARILECVAFPFSRESSHNPWIEPRSPTMQAYSLPAEPQGKYKNTGMGSLSLLQWIFPTQELNRGLQHCRQILYQLSYQGSAIKKEI